jgi:threonine dehydratase
MSTPTITRDAIEVVYNKIRTYIRRTPVIEADAAEFGLDEGVLVLKLEQMQYAGSFKVRGAFAHLLLRNVPQTGVAAASGGNHGAAVAYAAKKFGYRATIFVPRISSPSKTQRIRDFGADLVIDGECYMDALARCMRFVAETGAMGIHAYDAPETLLGQGTVALELEEQAPGLDTLLGAVGGGGLIGGIAAWCERRIRVIGVEPEAAPTLHRAFEAGHPVDVEVGGIAADSLGAKRAGNLMFPLARVYVEDVVLVSDGGIRDAQEKIWRALRIVAEPGGAAAFAALVSGAYRPAKGERVGVLVCGGNTSAVDFSR